MRLIGTAERAIALMAERSRTRAELAATPVLREIRG